MLTNKNSTTAFDSIVNMHIIAAVGRYRSLAYLVLGSSYSRYSHYRNADAEQERVTLRYRRFMETEYEITLNYTLRHGF